MIFIWWKLKMSYHTAYPNWDSPAVVCLSLTLHTLFLFPTFTFDSCLSSFILYSCSLPLHFILVSHPSYYNLVPYLYIWVLSLTLHTLFLFPTSTFESCLSPYILYSRSLPLHLILLSLTPHIHFISFLPFALVPSRKNSFITECFWKCSNRSCCGSY